MAYILTLVLQTRCSVSSPPPTASRDINYLLRGRDKQGLSTEAVEYKVHFLSLIPAEVLRVFVP